ncbi:MAG: hypothetical protein JNJ85_00175 [Candidatus Kapabacteria bacterium]|nr:hypothetical protein [Candidatus Kapabacteria bacterium]
MRHLLLSLFLALFVITASQESVAQSACPSGWLGPYPVTINYKPGCIISFWYCYSNIGGVVKTRVEYAPATYGCLEDFLKDPSHNYLLAKAMVYDLGTVQYNPIGQHIVPPCSTLTSITVTFESVVCKYLQNNASQGVMYVRDCLAAGVCRRSYQSCIDFTTDPPTPVLNQIGIELDGSSSCQEDFPIPPIDPPDGWISPCFMDPCQ